MKTKLIFIFSLIAILLVSCCQEVECTNPRVTLGFIGFHQSDLDSVIVRQFVKGSNFTSLIDSVLIGNTGNVDSLSDSLSLIIPNNISITDSFDYEIHIPSTNTLDKIDRIIIPQTQQQICSDGISYGGCSNYISSYDVNGISFTSGNGWEINIIK